MTINSFTSDELSGTSSGPSHGVMKTRLNEVVTAVNANTGHVDTNVVDVVIAVADAGAGGTTSALIAQANDLDGSAMAKACVFLILASDTLYAGSKDTNANVTFGTAAAGSILASGTGWAIVKTSATGAFACTATNAADEAVYFNAATADGGADALVSGVVVRGCIPDLATWS